MARRKKRLHKSKLIQFIITNGLHIWFILIIANVVLFSSFHWFSHGQACLTRVQVVEDNRCLYIWGTHVFEQGTHTAPYKGILCGADLNFQAGQGNASDFNTAASSSTIGDVCKSDQASTAQTVQTVRQVADGEPTAVVSAPVSQAVSGTPQPTATPTPTTVPGPVIDLSFTFPGIGSGGGTMNPLHKVRPVIIYLYPPNVSVFNKNIKPAYTVNSQVVFDDNKNDGTYTQFLNQHLDLGANVKDGQYQIFFKIDQALPKLITKRPGDVAGTVYSLNRFSPPQIPLQTVIAGDIDPAPHGNGIMDYNDYKALVGCFGLCPEDKKIAADLDDNGVVDGIDYNLMLLSFKTLHSLGYPVPTNIPLPPSAGSNQQVTKQPQPSHKLRATPSPNQTTKTASASKGSPLGGVLLFFFFVLLFGGVGFFVWKKGLLKKLKPTKQPPAESTQEPTAQASVAQTETAQTEQTQPEADKVDSVEEPAATEQSAVSPETTPAPTETPVESSPAAPTETSSPPESPASAPTQSTPSQPSPVTAAPTAATDTAAAGDEYFVKKKSVDAKTGGVWLTLTGDAGQKLAYYKGAEADIKDGFATVKGKTVKEGDTSYIYISEITFEE
jgi:hypothetical protein